MKLWLAGLALMVASSSTWAMNYRIVQSPSQKLDVWIDNVSGKKPEAWCGNTLKLRIVTGGRKDPETLKSFMPRLGELLTRQCPTLKRIDWQLKDSDGKRLANGSASPAKWELEIEPEAPRPETLSPPASRAQPQTFSLKSGCRIRTFWPQSGAMFIPEQGDGCKKGEWLNQRGQIAGHDVAFIQGYPVAGLSDKATLDNLKISTVSSERLVVSDERSPQSWMILPWSAPVNGWHSQGTVAVEMTRDQARDEAELQARLNEVRKVWSSYLPAGSSLTVLLIEQLHPMLRDPAAGAYRTLK